MQLQEGDWVRTDTGREGKIVVISADGVRAYVERGQTSILGVRLISFPIATLQKIDPPKPGRQILAPQYHSRLNPTLRYAVAVPSWVELIIFVVVTALVIVLIWHFPKMRRRK